jgi:hypothetical protein
MDTGIVILNIKYKNGCILKYPFLLAILLHVYFNTADKQNNQTT